MRNIPFQFKVNDSFVEKNTHKSVEELKQK
jgi:hypothetical protein